MLSDVLKGIYKGTANSEVLLEGKRYFLFPHGEHHYYVSQFNNPGAHTGCYEALHFELTEDEVYPELDRERFYAANLIHIPPGKYPSTPLKKYFVQPRKKHAYFWEDPQLLQLRGCFPLEWFSDFEEFKPIIIEEEKVEETTESEPIPEEPMVTFDSEQLSFDF